MQKTGRESGSVELVRGRCQAPARALTTRCSLAEVDRTDDSEFKAEEQMYRV